MRSARPRPNSAECTTGLATGSLKLWLPRSAFQHSRRVLLAQVPVFEILKKYDGVRIHDDIKNGRRRCAGCLAMASMLHAPVSAARAARAD